jgi:ABC-type multidrug transport system permease subunit
MRWLLTFIGFNAVLLIVVLLTLWAFGGFADIGLSGQGWIALALGIAFTSGIAVALMALVFHSARKDYDDDAFRIGRPDR